MKPTTQSLSPMSSADPQLPNNLTPPPGCPNDISDFNVWYWSPISLAHLSHFLSPTHQGMATQATGLLHCMRIGQNHPNFLTFSQQWFPTAYNYTKISWLSPFIPISLAIASQFRPSSPLRNASQSLHSCQSKLLIWKSVYITSSVDALEVSCWYHHKNQALWQDIEISKIGSYLPP